MNTMQCDIQSFLSGGETALHEPFFSKAGWLEFSE